MFVGVVGVVGATLDAHDIRGLFTRPSVRPHMGLGNSRVLHLPSVRVLWVMRSVLQPGRCFS